jgi:ABC-type transporter lipoprotein component MlaA
LAGTPEARHLDAMGEAAKQSALSACGPEKPTIQSLESFAVIESRRPVRTANSRGRRPGSSAIVLALVLGCGGCAGSPHNATSAEDVDTEHDPAEPVNRAIFKANVAADHAVMRPVAQAYADHVPEGVQEGIHNVVQNLKEPAVAVNDALQGNAKQAWESVQRLAVNSTVGVAGIFDVADKWGVPPHKADFGQTLAIWGVGEGPFVELPLLGAFECPRHGRNRRR